MTYDDNVWETFRVSHLQLFSTSTVFFFSSAKQNRADFSRVPISAWSRDICIMIDSFAAVFVNSQRDIGTSVMARKQSFLLLFVIVTFAHVWNWDTERNFEGNRATRPSIDFDVTLCSPTFLFLSSTPCIRSCSALCSSIAITVGPSLHELIGTWLIRELWLNYSTTLRVAVYVGSLENVKSTAVLLKRRSARMRINTAAKGLLKQRGKLGQAFLNQAQQRKLIPQWIDVL